MSEVQKADSTARRRAVLVVVFGAAIGALLIAGFEELKGPFHDWLTSDPAETPRRARLAIGLSAVMLAAPLVSLAVYLWLLGAKVLRAQQFPPPGFRVIRDTPVVSGPAAVTRGHAIQVFAVCLGVAAVVLCLFLWWLVGTLGQGRGEQGLGVESQITNHASKIGPWTTSIARHCRSPAGTARCCCTRAARRARAR